ncbi:MAG: hypothetical protein LBH93_08115 [Chitinispirillales bacterium]|nr:hypothetical protein [Chitinispirillales bacterium]
MIGRSGGTWALAGAAIITAMIVAAPAFAQTAGPNNAAAPKTIPANAVPADTAAASKAIPVDSIAVDTVALIAPADTVAVDAAAPKIIPVNNAAPAADSARAAPAFPAAPFDPAAAAPARRPRSREELGRMSREELFRLAFGRDAPDRPASLMMRLYGEGRPLGTVEISYNESFSAFTFASGPFSRLLDRMILPDYRAAAGDSVGHFSSAVLTAAGYSLDVNDTRYELRVLFPPEAKVLQKTNLKGGFLREPRGEEIEPAAVSFFTNYRIDERIRYMDYSYSSGYSGIWRSPDTLIRDRVTVNLDGALNVYGWVLESAGWVNEPSDGVWLNWENARRSDARIVRDLLGMRSKISLGDISIGSSIISGPAIGGARYEHNGWFFGNNPNDDQNSVTFFMAKPGEVEVFIDGMYRRRFHLPGGHHQITGFGGEAGRNTVRLVLRTADGATEEIPFEYILSNPRNMIRGDVRYSLSAGFRRDNAPSPLCFTYNPEQPLAGAELHYGLSYSVSVGVAAQASQNAGLAGAQILWTTGKASFLDTRVFASEAGPGNIGGRVDASYTINLRRPITRANRLITGDVELEPLPAFSLSLRGYCQSERYSQNVINVQRSVSNALMGGASGGFGIPALRGSVSLNGGANAYRETEGSPSGDIAYNYGVRVAQSIKKSYFAVSAGENVRLGVRTPYFSLSTNYTFGSGVSVRNHRFSTGATAGMSTRRVSAIDSAEQYAYDWRYGANAGWGWSNSGAGSGSQSYSANVRVLNDLNPSVSASMKHVYNRAGLNAGYGYGSSEYAGYGRRVHSLTAQAAGSFMFADGLWAFGRSMGGFGGGGFALVGATGDLKEADVHVNRSKYSGREFSKSGWLGAAYRNGIMPYSPAELALSLTDVPMGAVLEQSRYHFVSGYKRGYALRIGSIEQVIAQVRFVDKGGTPLSYHYLTIEPADEEDAAGPPRAAFTNSEGVLQAGGLQPGMEYKIKFRASANVKDAVIEIPIGADAVFEHPDVVVEREE